MFSKSIGILISVVTLSLGTEILDLPKGAESIALGNTGVAFSNEPNSVMINPANGAFYGARSGLNVWGSYTNSTPTKDSSIKLRTSSVGGYFKEGDWGAAVELSLIALNYGEFNFIDAEANTSRPYTPRDKVGSFSASLQWNKIVSVGATVKPITRHWREKGKAILFDAGFRGQYRKEFTQKFYIVPGVGGSFLNLGKDSISYENYSKPLVAKRFNGGVSFELGVPDAFWIMAENDISKLLLKNESNLDEKPTWRKGIQIGLTPLFQFNFGKEKYELAYISHSSHFTAIDSHFTAIDTVYDNRSEFHWGLTAGYRNIQFIKFLNQMSSSQKFSTDRRNFEILYSLGVVNHKYDFVGDFKTYTHQISGGIELGKKKK